jgi:hypothetical protein
MGIITFSIAAILSMPKQFITVYLGVILEMSSTGKPPLNPEATQIHSDVHKTKATEVRKAKSSAMLSSPRLFW